MEIIKTDDDKAKEVLRYLSLLEGIRQPYEAMVDNLIKFVNHGRRLITDKYSQKGQKTGVEVYDGTPISAKNLLVDGMVGYMCSRNQRWFSYTLPSKLNFSRSSSMRGWSDKRMDQIPEVKIWLEDCEDVRYHQFNESNFYDIIPEFVGDGASVGTAHLFCEEDLDSQTQVFTVPHFRECYIDENIHGKVDTIFRVYFLSLRQLREKFGDDICNNVISNFMDRFNRNPYENMEVVHAIYPRKDYDIQRFDKKNKSIASMWALKSPIKLLEESGYDYPQFISWRWWKNSDEYYGRGPAWNAYIDIMTGNQQAKDNLIAGHKMVSPPMVGVSDMRGKVVKDPDGWTWVDDIERQMPKPLLENLQLPYAEKQLERTDAAIKEHFHVNFFLMLYQAAFNKVDLTATQVLGMQGEQAAVLGTRVGRLESEAFDPIIDIGFFMDYRAGRLKRPPQILLDLGGKIEVDYLGPLSQAQRRLHKTRSIQAGIQLIGEIANIDQNSIDVIDMDETVKEALDATGFPSKLIRKPEEIARIREIRAKTQAEARQAEMLLKASKIMGQGSKSIAPDSAIGKLTGMNEQPEGAA